MALGVIVKIRQSVEVGHAAEGVLGTFDEVIVLEVGPADQGGEVECGDRAPADSETGPFAVELDRPSLALSRSVLSEA